MMLPGYHHSAAYDHHAHHTHHHHHAAAAHAALYPHHGLPPPPHGHDPSMAAMRPSRLFFKMPRVVPKQAERFEEEDIFKRNTREQEVGSMIRNFQDSCVVFLKERVFIAFGQ